MSQRGKGLEAFGNNNYAEVSLFSYSSPPCKKHPYSSTVGICAYCLKDRLVNLVCSECGEQRVSSSCSCSDVSSSHRNSCSTTAMEVGSVGRVSFLIENDQKVADGGNNGSSVAAAKEARPDRVIFLRRSSSSCVEVKKTNGFWKIRRLFRRSKGKQGFEKNDGWASDVMGVARSRSVCSFRGVVGGGPGGNNNFDDVYEDYRFSSAKISDVAASGMFLDYDKPRRSGVRDDVFDGENGVELKRVKSRSRSEFITAMDESSYIDLKLDSSDQMKQEFSPSVARVSTCSDDHGYGFFKGDGSENPLKRSSSRRHHSVWKWISKYHPRKGCDEKKYRN